MTGIGSKSSQTNLIVDSRGTSVFPLISHLIFAEIKGFFAKSVGWGELSSSIPDFLLW